MAKFKLPKKWFVIVTEENQDILSKWRFDDIYISKIAVGKIVGMVQWKKKGIIEKNHNPIEFIKTSVYDFGKEITFEQFEEYVLGIKKETIIDNYDYLIEVLNKYNIK